MQPSNCVTVFLNVLFALVFSFVDTKSLRWELVTFKQSIFNKVCNRVLLFMNVCQSQFAQALKGKACTRGDLLLSPHFQLCCSLGVPGPVLQVGVPVLLCCYKDISSFSKLRYFWPKPFSKEWSISCYKTRYKWEILVSRLF